MSSKGVELPICSECIMYPIRWPMDGKMPLLFFPSLPQTKFTLKNNKEDTQLDATVVVTRVTWYNINIMSL
jgi:hypothetical protein